MKKIASLLLSAAMLTSLAGCGAGTEKSDYTPIPGLDKNQKATLTIAIPYETNKALNTVANAFMKHYPNVGVELQYVEDYTENATKLLKDNEIDLMLSKDMSYTVDDKTGETTDDFFYNFAQDTEIDFSNTTPEITDNYRHLRTDESGSEIPYQYSYPLGGETRGVFVNKTLLEEYGLQVPTNYPEFLACCKTLKEAGLIPIQGNPDTQAYGLGLAVGAGAVTHDAQALARMAAAEPGVSEEFSDIMAKIYNLAVLRYSDYKTVEATGFFTTGNELGQSQSFLGLQTDEATFEVSKPENNSGYVAFMPYLSSTETVLRGLIDEYGLDTDLAFICSPMNDAGTTSPAYITPYYGICANKNSANLLWVREFVNFLFQEETIKTYAQEAALIPNSADALQVAAEMYHLNLDTDVTLCGQILFSDAYNGYSPISTAFKDTIKSGAQKYMINLNLDESGNIQYETDESGKQFLYLGNGETMVDPKYVGELDEGVPGFAFCTLDYYMDGLENNFAKYRVE